MKIRKIYEKNASLTINIPKEIGKLLKLKKGDYMSITHNKTQIILEKI